MHCGLAIKLVRAFPFLIFAMNPLQANQAKESEEWQFLIAPYVWTPGFLARVADSNGRGGFEIAQDQIVDGLDGAINAGELAEKRTFKGPFMGFTFFF